MGVKTFFPNFFLRLVSVNTARYPGQAVLKIPPRMTKTEVKEYLLKIYNVKVIKVNTTVQLGKWKRLFGKRRVLAFRERNFKRAYVDFETEVPKE